jgi:hypothetical protein
MRALRLCAIIALGAALSHLFDESEAPLPESPAPAISGK